LCLILIPLIYPEALPRQVLSMLLTAPPPPATQPPAPPAEAHQPRSLSEMQAGQIIAPVRIPRTIAMLTRLEPVPSGSIPGLDAALGSSGIPGGLFSSQAPPPVVHSVAKGPVHLSFGVVAGLLVDKTTPVYPPIAIAMRAAGMVVLQATISSLGRIKNLHVVSGPPVLQQAAVDAVRNWRYRPYLLNGQPVEVDTTINVIFSMNQ
jgi:protein TonB